MIQISLFLGWLPMVLLSISTTSLAHRNPAQLEIRQQVNCKDPSTGLDSSCWDTLQLTNWLQSWNKTTTTCNKGEVWTNCFIRLANKNPGTDCSVIGGNGCGPPSNNLPVAPSIEPEVYYILYNIFAINNFFSTWYTALQYATTIAGDNIANITQLINKEVDPNVLTNDILSALTVGLPFLGLIGDIPTAIGKTAGQFVLTALQQAPAVAKAIWPAGTDNSQVIQISQLSTHLGTLSTQLSNNLNAGLTMVESDLDSFIAFASTGAFSTNLALSVPKQQAGLELAFNLYLVSTSLNSNSWHAARALGVNPQSINGKFSTQSGTINCPSYDANGMCSYWYYSPSPSPTTPSTATAYTLVNAGSLVKWTDPSPLLTTIFDNAWTTGSALFDNVAQCSAAGNAGKGVINTDGPDGTLDLSCLSQLRMCSWGGVPREYVADGDCTAEQGWGGPSGHDVLGGIRWNGPPGYLGAFLPREANVAEVEVERTEAGSIPS